MADEVYELFMKTDDLIRQAEAAMPCCEENGNWEYFNSLREQLDDMPNTYTFVIAGVKVNKKHIQNLKVDYWSVKGNEYEQFCDHMKDCYGSVLSKREIRAVACLLENVHQHVKSGVGLCVVSIVPDKYKRISVIDNGGGFYNYKKQNKLSVNDAIKFGRSYGSRYKSLGQALAVAFGRWSDLSTVETPCNSVIIAPEKTAKKIARYSVHLLICLIIAAGLDWLTLTVRSGFSYIDIFIIVSIFGLALCRKQIASVFGKKSVKEYFPEIIFKTKNKREFGSAVTVYFCHTNAVRKCRKHLTNLLKKHLQIRAETLPLQKKAA
jgi:hypothetical protein